MPELHKACALCKGACCESFVLPLPADKNISKWLSLHGTPEGPMWRSVRFECACRLLKSGKCTAYNDRPEPCKEYKVGGEGCRQTIRTRRAHMVEAITRLIEDSDG